MANWTDRPARDEQSLPYRIQRCPATRELKCIIVSHKLIGTNLHYWRGRSTPCVGNECNACQAGQVPRWKGYFQALNEQTNVVQIIEVTERVYDAFEAATRTHGSLRGLGVRISRTNRRVNGPLQAEFDGVKRSDGELPDPVSVAEILERMWEQRQTAMPGCEELAESQGEPKIKVVG